MSTFAEYITIERVAQTVCKEAGKYAYNRDIPDFAKPLFDMLPAPEWWKGMKKQERMDRAAQTKVTARLKCIVLRHLRGNRDYPYIKNLRDFTNRLTDIARGGGYAFPKPTVKAIIKDDSNNVVVCRPICTYHDMNTKILISLMAGYLKSFADATFHYTNMAYRAPRQFMGKDRIITSNKHAIAYLLQWRKEHEGQNIFVAECDIRKFFDTIPHDVVKKTLSITMSRAGIKDDVFVVLFNSFIDSFNFRDDVYALNDNVDFWRGIFPASDAQYRFDWIETTTTEPLGIPQGAALSPIIANMVLNAIDEVFLGDKMQNGVITDNDLLFLRYCDDILLAHTSRSVCQCLIQSYCEALAANQFKYHNFSSVENLKVGRFLMQKDGGYPYWKAKSKNVYLWGEGCGNASRWIGFLGYEINRDGSIRIRKSSIKTQAEKICKRARRVAQQTNSKIRNSKLQKFEDSKIGGSDLSGFEQWIDERQQSIYSRQRQKLQQLKARKIRHLQTISN